MPDTLWIFSLTLNDSTESKISSQKRHVGLDAGIGMRVGGNMRDNRGNNDADLTCISLAAAIAQQLY